MPTVKKLHCVDFDDLQLHQFILADNGIEYIPLVSVLRRSADKKETELKTEMLEYKLGSNGLQLLTAAEKEQQLFFHSSLQWHTVTLTLSHYWQAHRCTRTRVLCTV